MRERWRRVGVWALVYTGWLVACQPASVLGLTFTVNSVLDAVDAAPGDGVCATAAGVCTLRAAIQEADAFPGADGIELPAQTVNNYSLTVGGAGEDAGSTGDLDITGDLVITGANTATTIVNGNGIDRVFDIAGGVTVSLFDITIQNGNPGAGPGGGIRNRGRLRLADVVLRNNVTTGDGGGIANLNGGTLELTNVTLHRNSGDTGGGLVNLDTATAQLTNVTINENTASSAGGGLSNSGGPLELLNGTISNNGANAGGGIDNIASTQVRDTIIANSTKGGNCRGVAIISLGHNLDSGGLCLLAGPGDLTNADPLLGAFLDYGGATPTRALLSGSPAIDAGDDGCPPTDQRGAARPADGNGDGIAVCDIGAFEVQRPTTPGTATFTVTRTATLTPPPPTSTSTQTPTVTPTITPTPTVTATPTATDTPTATPTATISLTPTSTRTLTPTPTVTVTPTTTPSVTPSLTPTRTLTHTATMTPTLVFNACCQCEGTVRFCGPPSNGSCAGCRLVFDAACDGVSGRCTAYTPTPTPTTTPTATLRPTGTRPPTSTPTATPTKTAGPNDCCQCAAPLLACGPPTLGSCAPCAVVFAARCDGPSGQCVSLTPSATPTRIFTAVPATTTPTRTVTASATATRTPTDTPTATATASATVTATATATQTAAPTATVEPTTTPTDTPSSTATPSPTPTATDTMLPAPTVTATVQPTRAETPPSVTPTGTVRPTVTDTATPTITSTEVPTATPTVRCPVDCDGNGAVTIDELITAVNIALGNGNVDACRAADADGNGFVTVDELIRGVNAALNGCGPAARAQRARG